MESGSENKSWDHAWTTEEMRTHRKNWSLAGDTGLLKHLEHLSDNITKKAEETRDAIHSMSNELNETAILVDNITNSSLALANSQFIESRVQEDNDELQKPVENADIKVEEVQELSANDLLASLCESIKKGLAIIDEKFDTIEVVSNASDDDDTLPRLMLKPKDPYRDRKLPYIIDSEEWRASSKVGLETSSESESEQNDEDLVSDKEVKNTGSFIPPPPPLTTRLNLGVGKLSSTSSESNISNIESSSIKGMNHTRVDTRSQDTLNSGTEASTPSTSLPKAQPSNLGPLSFADELAKRLGNVHPAQKNVIVQDVNEQIISPTEDDLFSQKDDRDLFNKKSDGLFGKGKNLFSDEEPSSWKNKPARPVNKNIIPPSLDGPPPLSVISSAPKSNMDDLFGDADESDDSDDIFSKKPSKNLVPAKKEIAKPEILADKQLNLSPDNLQNSSILTASTPEMNDKPKNLFEDDDDDDDLFKPISKQVKPPEASSQGVIKKKPIGGISIFGHVDILSSTKFPRRASSSSDSSAEDSGNIVDRKSAIGASIRSENSSKIFSPVEAGNNNVSSTISSNNNSNINNGSSGATSGISIRQPSSDNTAGSSLGADFQPLMSSSRLRPEDLYRERGVTSDSLLASKSSSDHLHQQQPQPSQLIEEDASEETEDAFGPPPLPKPGDASKNKSKVASLFDDSDSDSDLFASASPSSLRSQRSSEPTPSKTVQQTGTKKKSIFDDDDDLFAGIGDGPSVDLFSTSKSKVPDGLFDDVGDGGLFGTKKKNKVSSLFGDEADKDDLFGEIKKPEVKSKVKSLFGEPEDDLFGPVKTVEKKEKPAALFSEPPKSEVKAPVASNLTKETSKSTVTSKSSKPLSLFSDSEPEDDLFGDSKKITSIKKEENRENVKSEIKPSEEYKSGLFADTAQSVIKTPKEPHKDLFKDTVKSEVKKESSTNLFAETTKNPVKGSKSSSLFSEDDPEDDLFGDGAAKKIISEKKVESKLPSEAPKTEVETKNKPAQPAKSVPVEEKKKSRGLFDDDSEDSDLFAKISKPALSDKTSGSKGLFDDSSDSELFPPTSTVAKPSSSDFKRPPAVTKDIDTTVKKETPKKIIKQESAVSTKPKKLTSSIFDDSDDDDDLFGGSSLSKKKTSSIFKEEPSIMSTKKSEEDKKKMSEKAEDKPKDKKPVDKGLFDDDDDDDDLFGDKKKKAAKPSVEEKPSNENKIMTEPAAKPAAKAVLAEIKQKLEKHKLLEQKNKPESAVDGAAISRKESPKSLKIQTNLPIPPATDDSNGQPAPKKPVVSGKIKNLMGKMGDFKILSPTDTPPVMRKTTEEKSASENELEASGEAAGSEGSTPSLPSGASSPQTSGTNSRNRDSPSLKSDNTEVAVSFDEPAQVETLSSIASSKSRVRIPSAKRRPQSRQARHSALRISGIDFDFVDASPISPPEQQPNGESENVDRLLPSRTNADDRSEISVSRNTTTNLLSPSTDEEDLFDVPPDLPEDPTAKEDSLFGRAPILSPVETIKKTKEKKETNEKKEEVEKKDEKKNEEVKVEGKKEPTDPLRDESHDPLKDPSQLFAFVTKTPSPEKNKGLLLNKDDSSLFSTASKTAEKVETKTKTKSALFDDEDDTGSDLFSTSKSKLNKKPLRDSKIGLFGETESDDEDSSLFGSVTKKNQKTKNKDPPPKSDETKKIEKKNDSKNVKSTGVKDIFDNSSDEDDIFAESKKAMSKKKTTSLFDDNDDSTEHDDLFGKPKLPSMKESEMAIDTERPTLKKAITKDLKKTAEKIVEDPLSLLRDD